MVESNIEPKNVTIDTIKNGVACIRVAWNKEQVTRDDIALWTYDESCFSWVLPEVYSTLVDVQSYFDSNYFASECILNWAKATKLNCSSFAT
jgi:hypothetical protein